MPLDEPRRADPFSVHAVGIDVVVDWLAPALHARTEEERAAAAQLAAVRKQCAALELGAAKAAVR